MVGSPKSECRCDPLTRLNEGDRPIISITKYILFCNLFISDGDGQNMVWAIFHLLPIKLKFQLAIFSKFNIAIVVVNW